MFKIALLIVAAALVAGLTLGIAASRFIAGFMAGLPF